MAITLDDQVSEPVLVWFFITFQMIAWIGLSIVLMTAWLSPNVQRNSVWYNFCFSWVISGLSYSIPTLAGQQFALRMDFALCMVQATLIYAAPSLTVSTTLALVIELWFNLNALLSEENLGTPKRKNTSLLVFPYVVYFVVLLLSLGIGASNLDSIHRSHTGAYCVIGVNFPSDIVIAWVALVSAVAIAFEAVFARTLFKDWMAFRGLEPRSTNQLGTMIRISIFTLFSVLGMIVCLVMIGTLNRTVPDIALAMMPVASLLTFGTQMDIIRAWMFWKGAGHNVEPVLTLDE